MTSQPTTKPNPATDQKPAVPRPETRQAAPPPEDAQPSEEPGYGHGV
jgi:hypothetical protein